MKKKKKQSIKITYEAKAEHIKEPTITLLHFSTSAQVCEQDISS